MARRALFRTGLAALVSVWLAACQGGGANPPPFNTGTATAPGVLSASPSSVTFSGTGGAFAQTVNVTTNAAASAISVSGASCGTGASAIVSFAPPAGSGVSFTDLVTPVNPGTCTATISSSQGGSATVTFTVNSGSVTVAQWVSPNAASISITVVSVNGAPPTAAQAPVNPTSVALSTAAGGNCTVPPAGETCTVPLPLPTGSVQYLLQLKDSGGHILGRNTVTFSIAPAASKQSFAATVDGVVASVTVTLPGTHTGTAFSGPITVQAFDASSALIVGSAPYANAFTLTDSDTTGHTSLSNNGVTGRTVTVLTPNDVVILNYDGAAVAPYTVTATIPP